MNAAEAAVMADRHVATRSDMIYRSESPQSTKSKLLKASSLANAACS